MFSLLEGPQALNEKSKKTKGEKKQKQINKDPRKKLLQN